MQRETKSEPTTPGEQTSCPPQHMTDYRVAKKLKNSNFSQPYMTLVLKGRSAACVVASCHPVLVSRPSLTQKGLVHIKALKHLVLSRGKRAGGNKRSSFYRRGGGDV